MSAWRRRLAAAAGFALLALLDGADRAEHRRPARPRAPRRAARDADHAVLPVPARRRAGARRARASPVLVVAPLPAHSTAVAGERLLRRRAPVGTGVPRAAALAVAAALARLLRRDLALVPRPERRRARLARALAAARAVAAHLRAARLRGALDPARDRLGGGPRLARRRRGLRGRDVRPRVPHPARAAAASRPVDSRRRRPRAAAPLRARVRVPPASARA